MSKCAWHLVMCVQVPLGTARGARARARITRSSLVWRQATPPGPEATALAVGVSPSAPGRMSISAPRRLRQRNKTTRMRVSNRMQVPCLGGG